MGFTEVESKANLVLTSLSFPHGKGIWAVPAEVSGGVMWVMQTCPSYPLRCIFYSFATLRCYSLLSLDFLSSCEDIFFVCVDSCSNWCPSEVRNTGASCSTTWLTLNKLSWCHIGQSDIWGPDGSSVLIQGKASENCRLSTYYCFLSSDRWRIPCF